MNGNQSVIKKYLSDNGYFMKQGDKRVYTHLLLDGGKICIPQENRDKFLTYYAQRLNVNDEKLYMIENKTEIFRLFFDLDLLNSIALPEETLKHIIVIIQKSIFDNLGDNYTPHETRVIVCTCKNKQKNIGGKLWEKTGIHLRWPEIFVDKQTALGIRNICLEALNKHGGTRPDVNPWEDVIDKCVFEANGIRMIGSRKIQPCQHCRSRKIETKTCNVCKGSGKIDEGRPYRPFMVIDGKGNNLQKNLQKLKENNEKMIKEVSIQSDYEKLPKEINIIEKFFVDNTKKKQKKLTEFKGTKNLFNIGGDAYESANSQMVTLEENKMKKLQKFVNTTMPNVYKDVKITNIKRVNYENYICYLLFTDSRFCMNLNDLHNSNRIYFLIDKNYIYQKCWCRCETLKNRRFGYCKDYKSEGRLLDSKIQDMLFPDEKKNIKTTMYVPPIHVLKNGEKNKRDLYEKSLSQATDQLFDRLINKKEYEDKIAGRSLKMNKINKSVK